MPGFVDRLDRRLVLQTPIQPRIRERREAFGASLQEMAELADPPEARWREIEAGAPVSATELFLICQALAVDLGSFLRGEERDPRRSVARFRQAVPLPGKKLLETRTLALAAELGRTGGGLYQMLGRELPLARVRQMRPVSPNEEPWKQGYRLGIQARKSLVLAGGPIPELQRTLEIAGIHVATLPFSQQEMDAASLVEPGAMPVLLLNSNSRRVNQVLPRRTAMAHELCHLLYDSGDSDLETRMSRQFTDEHHEDAIEKRARAFAPAFLAPPPEVKSYFRTGAGAAIRDPRERIVALARRWGLSWSGAVWHAKSCDLIPSEIAEQLDKDTGHRPDWQVNFERLAAEDAKNRELEDISPLCQGRIVELVAQALEAGIISEGRAREILTWG